MDHSPASWRHLVLTGSMRKDLETLPLIIPTDHISAGEVALFGHLVSLSEYPNATADMATCHLGNGLTRVTHPALKTKPEPPAFLRQSHPYSVFLVHRASFVESVGRL